MSKFQTWSYLLNQWELRPFEILEHLKKRLQPYTKNGIKFPCPKEFNQAYSTLKKNHIDVKGKLVQIDKAIHLIKITEETNLPGNKRLRERAEYKKLKSRYPPLCQDRFRCAMKVKQR